VQNARYNPHGRLSASQVAFPYHDASFDFAFAASVFTHLDADECRHYLAEARRVLRPGGRLMATFFLVDDDVRALLQEGHSTLDFGPTAGGVHTLRHRAGDVHFAVAYEEPLVRQWFAASGLTVAEPVRAGAWCGRANALSYQDILLARPAP
jgi:SAM-dependent methyltransferase